jgi:hypothetical protein
MNNRTNFRSWGRPSLFAALAAFATLAALPSFPVAAHGTAHDDTTYEMALDCQLGSVMDYSKSCVFDTNGDGFYDWSVYDTDGDSIFDTSELDTDFDGRAETFYTIKGTLYGEVVVRYDHDGDWLYDDEEIAVYSTSPFLWDTDGDSFGDNMEIAEGSDPLDPMCIPYACG